MGKIGLEYSCSVWDTTSAKEIASLNPILIKVGSPSNQHWELQKVLRDEYEGEVHISTGMTTKDEIEQIVSFWEEGQGTRGTLQLHFGLPCPLRGCVSFRHPALAAKV